MSIFAHQDQFLRVDDPEYFRVALPRPATSQTPRPTPRLLPGPPSYGAYGVLVPMHTVVDFSSEYPVLYQVYVPEWDQTNQLDPPIVDADVLWSSTDSEQEESRPQRKRDLPATRNRRRDAPKKRKVAEDEEGCAWCKNTLTTQWRRSEENERICNRCGLHFKNHGRRPSFI